MTEPIFTLKREWIEPVLNGLDLGPDGFGDGANRAGLLTDESLRRCSLMVDALFPLQPQRDINRQLSAHELKHHFEDGGRRYCTLGEFILAAIACGFEVEPAGNDAYFNFDPALINEQFGKLLDARLNQPAADGQGITNQQIVEGQMYQTAEMDPRYHNTRSDPTRRMIETCQRHVRKMGEKYFADLAAKVGAA